MFYQNNTKEILRYLRQQSEDYHNGYLDGYETARNEIVKELKELNKQIKKKKALSGSTSTK